MKILFVVKSTVMENLGVMYLSAVVRQCGSESKIVDLDHALRIAVEWKPDIIGYSIMTGSQREFFILDEKIWKRGIHAQVFVGGPHASFFPTDPLIGFTDNIITGEGEQFFADLLQSGIKYPNIDDIPWPDRTDFPEMKIRDFISSRGCPHNCGYCYNQKWATMHPQFDRVRIRSAKDVCKEVEIENPEFAYFQDSCFALKISWMEEFADNYCGIPYHCHFRPKQINPELIALLKMSNCASIRMALESASDNLRKLMNRPKLDTNNVMHASQLLKKAGISFMIQNILAIPTSTIEDDLATLEFNISCRPDYAWSSIFVPYPGTSLGDMCIEEGWFKGNYKDITDSFFNRSVLNFSKLYKEQSYVLQKVFALCVEAQYMPKASELSMAEMPMLIHKIIRKMGDTRLYRGII